MPSPTRQSTVTLREITAETVGAICGLRVSDAQNQFVAPNAYSIAEAYFAKHAWFRAIYADDTPVGFAMISDQPEKPVYYLWRFMIDHRYQGLGFGRHALQLLIAHMRQRPGATAFLTSVVQAEGGPQRFYEKSGFQLTGAYDGGEAVMSLTLPHPHNAPPRPV